jgi:hypothetical protein
MHFAQLYLSSSFSLFNVWTVPCAGVHGAALLECAHTQQCESNLRILHLLRFHRVWAPPLLYGGALRVGNATRRKWEEAKSHRPRAFVSCHQTWTLTYSPRAAAEQANFTGDQHRKKRCCSRKMCNTNCCLYQTIHGLVPFVRTWHMRCRAGCDVAVVVSVLQRVLEGAR